jgi:hypothetical protein
MAVRNVFETHRIIAQQKARISALRAHGHATQSHEQFLKILERRLGILEDEERRQRAARESESG